MEIGSKRMGHMGMIRGLMNYPATKQINNPTNIGSIVFFLKYMGLLWYTHGYGNFHGCLDVKKAGILSSFKHYIYKPSMSSICHWPYFGTSVPESWCLDFQWLLVVIFVGNHDHIPIFVGDIRSCITCFPLVLILSASMGTCAWSNLGVPNVFHRHFAATLRELKGLLWKNTIYDETSNFELTGPFSISMWVSLGPGFPREFVLAREFNPRTVRSPGPFAELFGLPRRCKTSCWILEIHVLISWWTWCIPQVKRQFKEEPGAF